MKLGQTVVRHRVLILILTLVLLVPSVLGMLATRINYDMLNYLPDDMDTTTGQDILMDEFGKGAFSFLILEDMPPKAVVALEDKLREVEHVDTVLWYDSLLDISVPMEMLPQKVYDAFNAGNCTMVAVFFDTSTSADETMQAIASIREIAGRQCFVTGMSAMVTDLKELCEKEEPIYVGLAVLMACIVMMLFMDSWIIPLLFLASIGASILINMGTNYFLGEISYLTKALSAVLQLAVTMDYSIFLWHSYCEQRRLRGDEYDAMAAAIHETLISVIGSSITTIAGFIALCFMTFTLGKDLGIVMAKGVILGVIGCVTVLPALILVLDKPIEKTRHRALLPDMGKAAQGLTRCFHVFLAVFAIAIVPAYYAYSKTNETVYYDLGATLPEDMDYVIANTKLKDTFHVGSTHMLLVDASLEPKQVKQMTKELEQVDGVKYVLGMESVVGSLVPEEMIPDSVRSILESDNWELLLINSEYTTASDAVNSQIDQLNGILKQYDRKGMLIGEAPCTKDMTDITDRDFKVVNAISILAIFLIILFVEKSISLPVILVAVIELSIFINLGIPYLTDTSLPFIAPICISTIQLGATVDYAILMTTRYKKNRFAGMDKREAVSDALRMSIPSITVSALGLFASTFGVTVYSDVDIISALCTLMARGAIISMLCVILILPAMFMLCDGIISKTTIGFLPKKH